MTGEEDKRIDTNDAAASRLLLERKIARSRRLMLVEKAWPRLWLPVGVVALFVLASMAGLWPLLPPLVHGLGLGLFVLVFILSLIPLMRLQGAERGEALRWLERRSGLPHRPASALDDRLASAPDEPSRRLWHAHLARMRRHVEAMRTGMPRPDISRFDPYALRVPLMLALFAALGLAPHRLKTGLAEAVTFGRPLEAADLRLDAWIAPPSYTGATAVMLADGGNAGTTSAPRDILVPQHSELVVRVWGTDADTAELVLKPLQGDRNKATESDAIADGEIKATREDKVQDLRVKLRAPVTAELRLGGGYLAAWQIGVSPDNAPAIALTEPPAATARSTLRLSYRIADDYGVAEAKAHIRKPGASGGSADIATPAPPAADDLMTPIGEPPDVGLALPKAGTRRGNARSYADLTAHPWAGGNVVMTLSARDDAGNVGKSTETTFVLPARNFSKPLARAIIEQRRALAERPIDRLLVAGELDSLADRISAASDKVEDSAGVYLGLRSAYWRLIDADDRDTVGSVIDQLWDMALAIEDGNISQAERDLRAAQDKLMDALANNASPEEIEKLTKELRQALANFLNAMAQNQPQNQNADQQQGSDPNQKTITARQLDELLKNIENMAKTGARDAAQKMLSQLRDMLENLSRGNNQQSAGDQKMRQTLDELGKMIMDQRKLLDETHRSEQQQGGGEPQMGEDGEPQMGEGEDGQEGQEGQQGQQGMDGQQGMRGGQRFGQRPGRGGKGRQQQAGKGSGELQRQQNGLLNDLNGLLDKLNSMGAPIPDDLMRAGSEMGRAGRELGDEQLGAAQSHQGKALDNLRKGAQSLAEEMMKNRPGSAGQTGRDNRDPLGRPRATSGPEFGDDVKVPDEIDTQRARNILEELRRRASEAKRPQEELDYLERLIQQF